MTWKNASVGATEVNVAARLIDVAGMGTSVAVDVTASALGTSLTQSSGNVTTTASYESQIGAITIAGSSLGLTAGPGWTNTEQTATAAMALESIQRVSTAIEQRAANGTTLASGAWVAIIATFKSTSSVIAVSSFNANATYNSGSAVAFNFGTMLDRTTFAAITKTSAMTAVLEVTLTLVSG